MNYMTFLKLYNEAKEYDNIEYYIAERGWEEWMESFEEEGSADKIAQILYSIYSIAHMSFSELREWAGIKTRAELCRAYKIPDSTVQDWENGKRVSPYIISLIAYTLWEEKNNAIEED